MVFYNERSGINFIKTWVTSITLWAFFSIKNDYHFVFWLVICLHYFIISLIFLIERIVITCMWTLNVFMSPHFNSWWAYLWTNNFGDNFRKNCKQTQNLPRIAKVRPHGEWFLSWCVICQSGFLSLCTQLCCILTGLHCQLSSIIFLLKPSYHLAYCLDLLCLFSFI